ncbi:MAG TPA: GNAT family N-acetyltransferase [Phycisphaerae bacterium]|nr:GNAT family N-acetyltransferase [Phycisphaerae bacterium]
MDFRTHVLPTDPDHVRRMAVSSGFFRDDEVPVAVELVEETLARGPAAGYSYIFADVGGVPVGYACFGLLSCTLARYGLYWIIVDNECRGQGIGRELLRRVEDAVRSDGGERLYIETSMRELYAPTRRFYEKCEYVIAAELPEYYARGDGKVIYLKCL